MSMVDLEVYVQSAQTMPMVEVGSFVTTGAGVVGDNVGAMLDDERVGIDVVGCDEG